MKHTNMVTPRSLNECHFQPSMDPIEHYQGGRLDWRDKLVLAASVAAAVACAVIVTLFDARLL